MAHLCISLREIICFSLCLIFPFSSLFLYDLRVPKNGVHEDMWALQHGRPLWKVLQLGRGGTDGGGRRFDAGRFGRSWRFAGNLETLKICSWAKPEYIIWNIN